MSLAAQGAYLKLLCFMWADSHDQCSILDDNALIARGLGTTVEQWLELRAEIQCESDPIFEQKSGCLLSARLRHEADKQRKYRKNQSAKGKRSAQQRFNRSSTVVQPMYQPEGNSSSSLKEPKKEDGCSHIPDSPLTLGKPAAKRKPAASFLPESFSITDDLWEWAAKKEFSREFVERQFEKFCLHNKAKAERFVDWDAAFQKWLIKAQEFICERNGHGSPPTNGRRLERRERIPL
jgi:uncharacterized protein YdaU (DUF1376 family)